jgi:Hyphally regulated cell wall protein N-terminal
MAVSETDGGFKPAQTGLVDMGDITFYGDPSGPAPTFNISDLTNYPGSFGEIVLNVTWSQLQPTENGPLDTSAINSAIAEVQAYNATNGTDLGIKLRVWGGFTAPAWAQNIDGPPITVTGQHTVDPNDDNPQTIGRFWTADYIDAWTGLQNQLAAIYDSNPLILGISQTAGAAATDEPFVPLLTDATLPAGGTANQIGELQAAGYTDAAEELTLRAASADYSSWATTPLDYTMNLFHQQDGGHTSSDENFTLAVLQEAENANRQVQAGNHALDNPLYGPDAFVYAQMAQDATLDPGSVPGSYQTASPVKIAANATYGSAPSWGPYADWPNVVSDGVAANAGDIELWDLDQNNQPTGFTGLSPVQVQELAGILAAGTLPVTPAPDDGAALGFIAPASVSGTPGRIAFTGVGAVLLASASSQASFTVVVTSTMGGTLGVTDFYGIVNGPVRGTMLSFVGTLGEVNTVLASLTDTVSTGNDVVKITAKDSAGDSAIRFVGVTAAASASPFGPVAPQAASSPLGTPDPATFTWTGQGTDALFSDPANWAPTGDAPGSTDTALFTAAASPAPAVVAGTGASATLIADDIVALAGGSAIAVGQNGAGDLAIASRPGTTGTLILGGVESALSVAGDLQIGANGTLLAALAPSAYSTASLTIGGTLDVGEGATARFTGALGAGTVDVASGGMLSGDGTVTTTGSSPIVNDGTIEAASDQTLGLQQLTLASPIAGSGQLLIDPGATLILAAATGPHQVISFAPPTIAELSNDPNSPSSLTLEAPFGMQGTISGFSFADSLVLDGVTASGASYDSASGTLTVDQSSGSSLSFSLSGVLSGLVPFVSVTGSGVDAESTIVFVAPASGALPSVSAPASLEGAVDTPVGVPNIVLETPLPVTPPNDLTVTAMLSAGTGMLGATNDDNGDTTITHSDEGKTLTLSGMLGAVETSLQSLSYTAAAGAPADSIKVTVSDYAGVSDPVTIVVSNNSAPLQFNWAASDSGSFADPTNWAGGGAATTPPGGTNVASFGAGTYSVSGDGAVGEVAVTGAPTLTGQITAQGCNGTAINVDGGGALTLAGGAVLTAEQQAVVGNENAGALAIMGGALTLTGEGVAGNLVIGENAGSTGTVFDLEQIAAAGTVMVGDNGSGTLRLLGVASSLSDSGADLGVLPRGEGTVSVNGGEWTSDGLLTVGDRGAGALLIGGTANGISGQVTALDATIGAQVGGQGNVTLAGGDLLVANAEAASSTLTVGAGGAGSLTIDDGGDATVGEAQGTVPNGTPNGLTVTDTGMLAVGDSGQIQISGNGALEVDGSASIDGSVTVGQSKDDSGLFALAASLAIDGPGTLTLGGADATVRGSTINIAQGGKVSGAGTLSGDGGGNDTVMVASITNDGTITASGGNLLVYGNVAGAGDLTIDAGATVTLQASVAPDQTLAFSPNAEAVLDDPSAFEGTVNGFGSGDELDLASVQATAATWSAGALTLQTSAGPVALNVAGNYAENAFSIQSDGLGGTLVTLATGGGQGDVHMTTFDGLHYDFQAVGDFVAVRSTEAGNPFQIQIATAAEGGNVSITTELAAALRGARVNFVAGRADPVSIDGAPDATLSTGATQNITGGTLSELSPNTYRLSWSTGESVTVIDQGTWLDWSVSLGAHDGPGSVQGLLGSDSGAPKDFQLPDGTVLSPNPGPGVLLGTFADAWRVAPDASLLDDPIVSPAASSASLRFMAPSDQSPGTAAAPTALEDALAESSGDLLSAFSPVALANGVGPSPTAASSLIAAPDEAALLPGTGLAHSLLDNSQAAFTPHIVTADAHL